MFTCPPPTHSAAVSSPSSSPAAASSAFAATVSAAAAVVGSSDPKTWTRRTMVRVKVQAGKACGRQKFASQAVTVPDR